MRVEIHILRVSVFAAVRAAVLAAPFVLLSACGVRGRPQPPLTPPELGRGQPTFKRATEEFRFENVPSPESAADTTATPTPSPRPGSRPGAYKPSRDGN